jgi:hypothetical protein
MERKTMGREKGFTEGILMNQFATLQDFQYCITSVCMNGDLDKRRRCVVKTQRLAASARSLLDPSQPVNILRKSFLHNSAQPLISVNIWIQEEKEKQIFHI